MLHISMILSKSKSDIFSGPSIAIFNKFPRLESVSLFRNLVLIVFIAEKLRSTEAVLTGRQSKIDMSLMMLGNICL